ncbi:MAG: hypothetical protein H6740_19645 [Alphaproteobacteria bacterium]|nr:hypothetical protein [Alphaproteobacteria bacterium]
MRRVLSLALTLGGLVACLPGSETSRVYGGGELSLSLVTDEVEWFEEVHVVPGLVDELPTYGKDWASLWPDCEVGEGAWVYLVDGSYPRQLRACGQGFALRLDMGWGASAGSVVNPESAGAELRLAASTLEVPAWRAVPLGDVQGAALALDADSFGGSYSDDEVQVALPDQGVEFTAELDIAWAFDDEVWILAPEADFP